MKTITLPLLFLAACTLSACSNGSSSSSSPAPAALSAVESEVENKLCADDESCAAKCGLEFPVADIKKIFDNECNTSSQTSHYEWCSFAETAFYDSMTKNDQCLKQSVRDILLPARAVSVVCAEDASCKELCEDSFATLTEKEIEYQCRWEVPFSRCIKLKHDKAVAEARKASCLTAPSDDVFELLKAIEQY